MATRESTAPAEAQPSRPSVLIKAALSHARMRDRWMRRARERRPVPFLPGEVARCVRCARDENRALIQTLRLIAVPAMPREALPAILRAAATALDEVIALVPPERQHFTRALTRRLRKLHVREEALS